MRRILLIAIVFGILASAPAAQAAAPRWHLESIANSFVAPQETLEYLVYVDNVGDLATSGEYGLLAKLPTGLVAREASLVNSETSAHLPCHAGDGVSPVDGASSVRCSATDSLEPVAGDPSFRFRTLHLLVEASAEAAGTLTTSFSLSGGGAATTEVLDPTRVSRRSPTFGIDAFDSQLVESDGQAATAAGAHPYADLTNYEFVLHTDPSPLKGTRWPVGPVRDVRVDLPPGQLGNPSVMAQCTLQQLSQTEEVIARPACPPASQVGDLLLATKGNTPKSSEEQNPNAPFPFPVYNLVPGGGAPARFGVNILGTVVVLNAELRSGGDYGVSIVSRPPAALVIQGNQVEFWGDPAAVSHDVNRNCPGERLPPLGPSAPQGCPGAYIRPDGQAFLRNPTSCTAPGEGLTTTMRADSWFEPGVWSEKSVVSHEGPGYPLPDEPSTFPEGYSGPISWGPTVGIEGCAAEPFSPSFTATPTTEGADSPTGFDVQISMPQQGLLEPEAISESDLKTVAVKLPEGMSVNPAAAGGQAACSAAQIGYETGTSHPYEFTEAPQGCPDAAKIGTVELESPLLTEPEEPEVDRILHGAVYLAKPSDNPFNSLLAMYLVVEDEQSGVTLKLPGRIEADPQTGRLETVFDENPQLPFEALRLHLFGGPRAALKTPPACGTYSSDAALTGWSGAQADQTSSFTLTKGPGGGNCPSGAFNPKLEAGTQNPLAGQTSPFSLRLSREDGTQQLAGLTATLPPGLSGYLAGIPYCPDGALAAVSSALGTGAAQEALPSCPAASQVGTVTVGAGAGANPFYTSSGRAYLAGPYKGAPLSLVVIAPAVAGPFDLGSVLVRNALQVNPETAQITAVSDPLPSILHGIPLDLRDVRVELDRPHFTLNPTSCEPMQIAAAVSSTSGATANPAVHFQAADCGALGFKPKLQIKLKGKTARTGHPALTATLTMPPGQADISRALVSLPHSEFLAQSHIRTICTRVQYAAAGGGGTACPPGSVYGHAVAYTPLLGAPLEGNVYLRSSSNPLPDLVASLSGQIHIDLVGRVSSNRKTKGLVTTFEGAPDAPVSKFVLSMPAGSHSLLENSENLCARAQKAIVQMTAHNGKLSNSKVKLKVAGCRKHTAHRRHGKRHRHHR